MSYETDKLHFLEMDDSLRVLLVSEVDDYNLLVIGHVSFVNHHGVIVTNRLLLLSLNAHAASDL